MKVEDRYFQVIFCMMCLTSILLGQEQAAAQQQGGGQQQQEAHHGEQQRHAIVILIFDIRHWDIGDTFATHSLQTVVGKVVVK